jgi:AcrR family transcriptional regulator
MTRRRRSAKEARAEILEAAETLLREDGPEALTITAIARAVGVSHPAVLHHFGSVDALEEALHMRISVAIRDDLLGLLASNGADRAGALEQAMARLADPTKGRMLAWLVATGRPMFPPASDKGLAQVAETLQATNSIDDVSMRIQLAVLAMVGEAMCGAEVRARLGLDDACGDVLFRRWLLSELMVTNPSA